MRAVRVVAVVPCPLLPLEEEGPGSRELLVGVGVLGVGGFGHVLLLAHISQSGGGGVRGWGGHRQRLATWRFCCTKLARNHGDPGAAGLYPAGPQWGNVCPARYLCIKYPISSPKFIFTKGNPPSRPH